ncbi:MAG: hypothetical protein GY712_14815 [Oceanicoccus sp.]|uniref:hypothetical protein n=1 Tax=Oceanicoccus sp. TaxID=2691044 RepID=UPI00260FB074|nr:hypothetical protein [Oceanicoccus sp.]MCP3909272.1 hypothetical protein [Oceanicoccus sp.]MCP4278265.1 hypothetical protein [Gammaproteobacteria bacterium]MCP4928702.1 hypothetical protein [Gammaproteobacteria bacterium]
MNKNYNSLLLVLFVFPFAASAAGPDVDPIPFEITRSRVEGVNYTASVGELVYSEAEAVSMEGAVILGSLDSWRHKVPANTELLPRYYTKSGASIYCTRDQTLKNAFGGDAGRSCFADSDGDGKFESVASLIIARSGEFTLSPKEMTPIPYKLQEVSEKVPALSYSVYFEGIDNDLLRFTLIFEGQNQGCIYGQKATTYELVTAREDGLILPLPMHLRLSEKKKNKKAHKADERAGVRIRISSVENNIIAYKVFYNDGYWRYWIDKDDYVIAEVRQPAQNNKYDYKFKSAGCLAAEPR